MQTSTRLVAILGLCLLGCDDNSIGEPTIGATQAPVALDAQLAFVDSEHQRAHLFDVSAMRPSATTLDVKLPAGASSQERRNEHDEVLVLCAGRRDGLDADAEPAALVAIDNAGKARTYEFGTTPFNALQQSQDGRYAVLFRNGMDDSRTLNNPNELVVVDLDKGPKETGAVTRKTPDGLGHTLTRVIVSPQMRIVNEDRRLLVILSAAEVTLFDLNHLDRRAIIVQLDETRTINPAQVEFSKQNASLYVRAQNSDNIFMFRFEARGDRVELSNDFRPTINVLGGGNGPRDMALFGDGSDERLLVVAAASAQALVIDPNTSKTYAVKLSVPAERIQLFKGARLPVDAQVRDRALLYAGDKRASVTFLDLHNVDADPEDRIEVLTLSAEITNVIPLKGNDDRVQEVVFQHLKGVTILNLEERTLTPISSNTSLTNAIFDSEHKRLWVGTAGTSWVGTLDLQSGRTNEVLLDAPLRSIIPMIAVNRLVVLHDSAVGYATLFDLDRPTRESAISVRGYFVSGLLDRGAP